MPQSPGKKSNKKVNYFSISFNLAQQSGNFFQRSNSGENFPKPPSSLPPRLPRNSEPEVEYDDLDSLHDASYYLGDIRRDDAVALLKRIKEVYYFSK